jgi:CRISPR/Cas system-associated endonuclease/helicase Cas3
MSISTDYNNTFQINSNGFQQAEPKRLFGGFYESEYIVPFGFKETDPLKFEDFKQAESKSSYVTKSFRYDQKTLKRPFGFQNLTEYKSSEIVEDFYSTPHKKHKSNFSNFDESKCTFGKPDPIFTFYDNKVYDHDGPTNFASVDPSTLTFGKSDRSFTF